MEFKANKIFKNIVTPIALAAIPPSAFASDGLPPVIMENKLAIAIGIFLYLLPSWIAYSRKHPSLIAIILVNVFLGISVLGWIVALIWSCTGTKQIVVVSGPGAAPSNSIAPVASSVTTKSIGERIADLKAMLDSGAITQAEFDALKADALKAIS